MMMVTPQYLQLVGATIQPIKQRSYAIMGLREGDVVLDVGCGIGLDAIALTGIVGHKGIVVGVDRDFEMLQEAEKNIPCVSNNQEIQYAVSDSSALPFQSNIFHATRSERVFQHVHDPEQTLSEMIRVTRPNGIIVVIDTDWNTLSIDTTDIEIERKLRDFILDGHLKNGYAGRQLYRLFQQHHLSDVAIEVFPLFTTDYQVARYVALLDAVETQAMSEHLVTHDEIERWRTNLEQRHHAGLFFASLNVVMVAGRKP